MARFGGEGDAGWASVETGRRDNGAFVGGGQPLGEEGGENQEEVRIGHAATR